MPSNIWQQDSYASEPDIPPWELFHENSKLTKFSQGLSEEVVLDQLGKFYESLPFASLPAFSLPRRFPTMKMSLRHALQSRNSVRQMTHYSLTLQHLAALLHFSYGINRDKATSGLVRSFRMAPSAGALYPLEIFFYNNSIEGLPTGIYHYNPCQHNLRLFLEGDQTQNIFPALAQQDVVSNSSLLVFITALFALLIITITPIKNGSEFIFLFAPMAIIITNYLEVVSEKWFKESLILILVIAPIAILML